MSSTEASFFDPSAAGAGRPAAGRRRSGADASSALEQRTFDDLVRATYTRTYTLALRLSGDEHDARDLAQETYLRAWRGRDAFRGEADVTTWLHRITVHAAADLHRRARRKPTEALDPGSEPVPDVRPGPADLAVRADDRRRLAAALALLPAKLRLVIVLHDIYDLPHDAVAAELGISVGATKVRLHRARRALRAALDAATDPAPVDEAVAHAL